jgi:hypothetical protein
VLFDYKKMNKNKIYTDLQPIDNSDLCQYFVVVHILAVPTTYNLIFSNLIKVEIR